MASPKTLPRLFWLPQKLQQVAVLPTSSLGGMAWRGWGVGGGVEGPLPLSRPLPATLAKHLHNSPAHPHQALCSAGLGLPRSPASTDLHPGNSDAQYGNGQSLVSHGQFQKSLGDMNRLSFISGSLCLAWCLVPSRCSKRVYQMNDKSMHTRTEHQRMA